MKFILMLITIACIVGCKRIGYDPGMPEPDDGMTAAQFNAWYLAGMAWPFVTPLLRFVAANISWSALATKQQKLADQGIK